MNNLWYRDTPVLSSFDRHYEYNTSDKDYQINNTTANRSGCPSRIHFGSSSYTLGFGHLFSGNLQYYHPFNPIGQCAELCSFGVPECYSNPSQQHPVMNNCKQSNIDKAAALLERAANAISTVANRKN